MLKNKKNYHLISLSEDVIKKFRDIDFLNSNRIVSDKYIILNNLNEANSLCISRFWEKFILDKSNDLTMYLSNHNKKLYNMQWNEWVQQSKKEIIPFLDQKINILILEKRLTESIRDDIKFNILSLINYIMYKQHIPKLEFPFLDDLLEVYEQGFIPVSYRGEYPNGNFIVI